ncbi:MAG: hypothetical protein IT189_06910 [Microbacteriaceae bacterium]|nr:hypothetical protein [Microbacteriaceae bacterium]
MVKSGLSATDLGAQIGLGAQDTNALLAAQGFLEGKPGQYLLTELGKQFGHHVSEDNGYGGVAYRDWYKTYFDESILSALDHSPETIAETRSAAKAARAAARALSAKEGEEYWAEVARKKLENGLSGEIDWKKVILIAGGVIVVTTTTVVVVKYAPAIKRGWTAKVSPALVAMKDRMTGKPAEES